MKATNNKFCGVCKNIGKSEAEYTSHYTKSVPGSKGIVVCPTILHNKCNKCQQIGHFPDHCLGIIKTNTLSQHEIAHSQSSDAFVEPLLTTFRVAPRSKCAMQQLPYTHKVGVFTPLHI